MVVGHRIDKAYDEGDTTGGGVFWNHVRRGVDGAGACRAEEQGLWSSRGMINTRRASRNGVSSFARTKEAYRGPRQRRAFARRKTYCRQSIYLSVLDRTRNTLLFSCCW